MELKVWVDGFQRIVCGVTDNTSCQDVVYALAHATGKVGRFSLIERWRCNERHLAPQENPLKILMKWGEYSSDVQFILQRSEGRKQLQHTQQNQSKHVQLMPCNNSTEEHNMIDNQTIDLERPRSTRKSFTFGYLVSDVRLADKVGIVRGVPQVKPHSTDNKEQILLNGQENINKNITHEIDENCLATNNLLDNAKKCSISYREPSTSLLPPPYRDPPPPTNQLKVPVNPDTCNSRKEVDHSSIQCLSEINESLLYNIQYGDLLVLVKYQKDKLTAQHSDLNKYDEDIEYIEVKTRDQQEQMDLLTREIQQADTIIRQGSEQLYVLSCVEEENEIIKQQEKTVRSEITLLRSKLANCETELLQCKNKIRLLLDELQIEQKAYLRRHQFEMRLMTEMEHLQFDIEHAKASTDDVIQTADALRMEVLDLESAIIEKKMHVESLVNEMKEVNLQSLTNTTNAEEIKFLLEGTHKPGSTRRMIGSPRQLENAVPTNKNPHGVWV
ncbi:ras association domain-containing protein 8-like isoform X2 [Ctenocephalides felis]|uniref:ras association domain-containing protein 8-like isoform X2 n=1 Tax=Ctenocephalides felis TaxID=7515 RepID=UPI000E6E582C|nr:ras association domain-containing protein 8-like isoform X2 [Ctenocephalides felis]